MSKQLACLDFLSLIHFDTGPRRIIKGLKFKSQHLTLPDERIIDRVFQFASSVWHLKDRLRGWVQAKGLSADVEVWAQQQERLLLCADLANKKKHGRHTDRSGLNPELGVLPDGGAGESSDATGLVRFDTSRSGTLELFYDGSTKEKELLVETPAPIAYRVDVLNGNTGKVVGDAIALIHTALCDWLPLLEKLGVLAAGDKESSALRTLLSPGAVDS